MKRLFFLSLAVAACSGPSSSPSSPEPTRAAAEAIQGGQADPSNAFAIALIGQGLCSGTLIAPNLVVTARHCVESQVTESGSNCENGPLAQPADLSVSTSAALDLGGGPPTGGYTVSRILPMPEVSTGCSPDIALVELGSNVASSVAKPARPAVEPAFLARKHFSDQVTAIGYGLDDNGQPGARRIKKNISVLCVPGDDQFPCTGGIQGADYEIVADKGPCQGDSGGGLYDQATFDANDPVIVATVSRGPVDGAGKCGPGVFVRVDKFKDFVIASAIDAAKHGGYDAPSWTSAADVVDAGADASAGARSAGSDDGGAPSAAPATTTTTHSGCAAARSGGGPRTGGAAWSTLALLAVAAVRRRRYARATRNERA